MSAEKPSVLVVGAGPTGLVLAAELAARGIDCTVVDKREQPSPHSRAFGLQPATLDLLDGRGEVADELVQAGIRWQSAPLGDGSQRTLSFADLRSRFPFMLIIPQADTERVLARWALDSGAKIERGVAVAGFSQDEEGVSVSLEQHDHKRIERYDWVVGCDGVNSTIRTKLGLEFVGRDYAHSLVVSDVWLAKPPDSRVTALSVARGMVAIFPFPDGSFRVVIEDNERMDLPVETPVTVNEIRESMLAILGTDHGLTRSVWQSRYRSKQRQATAYRVGRVLLAGDAAHTHIPSGGQGLQLGIADAVNLGWKLAGVATGELADGVLDTYQAERMPIAAAALRKTDLLFKFNTASSTVARSIRTVGVKLSTLPVVRKAVVQDLAGTGTTYPSLRWFGAHKLVGRRCPDVAVSVPWQAKTRVAELLRHGRPVVLQEAADALADSLQSGWSDRITRAAVLTPDVLPVGAAALVRPDGMVAWVGHNPAGARRVLEQWCGGPYLTR